VAILRNFVFVVLAVVFIGFQASPRADECSESSNYSLVWSDGIGNCQFVTYGYGPDQQAASDACDSLNSTCESICSSNYPTCITTNYHGYGCTPNGGGPECYESYGYCECSCYPNCN